MTYRILSLDGGGLRGLITARLLQRIGEESGHRDWLDQVDLIAGTSTGGILALALASGRTPEQVAEIYLGQGATIFDDSIWDNIRDIGKLVGAQYSNKALKGVLTKLFRATTLAQLRTKVTIPAFDLDNQAADPAKRSWKPKIFHNFAGPDSDGAVSVLDVAMYSSAAPTYFPSVDGYIDGGVFANNPSMVAIAQAISSRNVPAERCALDEIVLLSVGTGVSPMYVQGQTLDWGYAQWIKPLIELLLDGVSGIADYQSTELLGDRYHRLQPLFGPNESIKLDDVKKMPQMEAVAARQDLSEVNRWLGEHWG